MLRKNSPQVSFGLATISGFTGSLFIQRPGLENYPIGLFVSHFDAVLQVVEESGNVDFAANKSVAFDVIKIGAF